MNKNIITICLLLVSLVSCNKNPQLKAVLDDMDSSPRCVVTPVLTSERDNKDLLSAKIVILNDRVACMVQWYYYFDKKIQSYRDI